LLVVAELFSISPSAAPLLGGDSDGALAMSQLRWVPLLLSICLGLVAFGVTGLLRALSANITGLANEPELTTTGLCGDLALQQRERELAEKSALLQTTLDAIDQGFAVFDNDLRLAAWSCNYPKLLGYPPELMRRGTAFEVLVRFNANRGRVRTAFPRWPADVERGGAHLD
jgi:PAS domain-containing protein